MIIETEIVEQLRRRHLRSHHRPVPSGINRRMESWPSTPINRRLNQQYRRNRDLQRGRRLCLLSGSGNGHLNGRYAAHCRPAAFGPCMDGSPLARAYLSFCRCWLVRPCIGPVGAAFHVPLAIMPFARLRSRSKARTRSAWPKWVFLIRRYSTGFVHQLLSALSAPTRSCSAFSLSMVPS